MDFKSSVLEKIHNDKKLNSFIKELTSEELEDNLMILYNQALNNEKCKKCLGKKSCTMDTEFYQSFLTLEYGKVIQKLAPCKYVPKVNFDLVDLMYMPLDAFCGELYVVSERSEVINEALKIIKGETRKGLYLHGSYGTGKSYLAYNILNQFAKKGKTVVFCLVPEMIRSIKDNMMVHGYIDKLVVKLKNADVLVLDDLGGEMNSPFTRDEILFPILDHRMNDISKITFITSNLDPYGMETHFANEKDGTNDVAAGRIMERIRAISTPIELKGKNYRHEN